MPPRPRPLSVTLILAWPIWEPLEEDYLHMAEKPFHGAASPSDTDLCQQQGKVMTLHCVSPRWITECLWTRNVSPIWLRVEDYSGL